LHLSTIFLLDFVSIGFSFFFTDNKLLLYAFHFFTSDYALDIAHQKTKNPRINILAIFSYLTATWNHKIKYKFIYQIYVMSWG